MMVTSARHLPVENTDKWLSVNEGVESSSLSPQLSHEIHADTVIGEGVEHSSLPSISNPCSVQPDEGVESSSLSPQLPHVLHAGTVISEGVECSPRSPSFAQLLF